MAAESIHAASGTAHVAEQQLKDCRCADDLRPESMLRPAHRVDDRGGLLHVPVLADGGVQVGCLQELGLRYAGDALDHLGRVARKLLSQQLEDASRMLESEVVGDIRW